MLIPGEFSYRSGLLACEEVDLSNVAEQYGTPAYIYSQRAIQSRYRAYKEALAGLPNAVCFAVKANSNLSILQILAREGAGFDIVSGGELYRVLKAGGDPAKVVFSGVGKTEAEIHFALDQGIRSFNCESEAEVEMVSAIAAAQGRVASVAIRVNPDVNAVTHPYISTGLREHKFGIDIESAEAVYRRIAKLRGIRPDGVSCHIGSQILDAGPLVEAAEKMFAFVERLRAGGLRIDSIDLGGGLGVPYADGDVRLPIHVFVQRLRERLEAMRLTLMLEPGRSIVAEAGVLLTRVLLVKKNGSKTFVIVDAGMNDLIRPALYHAHHEITAVRCLDDARRMIADVVGPVCESGDFFARSRDLPALQAGDLVAIQTAGAYGFVLASNYNSRPRPVELLIDGANARVVRERESLEDLIRGERLP